MADEWTDKPDAHLTMYAEVVDDPAVLDELHAFFAEIAAPIWLIHGNAPPHPSRNQLTFYFDRGNPIIVVRDADRLIWAYRINGRSRTQNGLWAMVRREADYLHDYGGDGMSVNSRESWSHLMAMSWALAGGIQPVQEGVSSENPYVSRAVEISLDAMRSRATVLYEAVYRDAVTPYVRPVDGDG